MLDVKYGFCKKLFIENKTCCNVCNAVCPPHSNFDDWKWSTEQRCIRNEITTYKIYTLVDYWHCWWATFGSKQNANAVDKYLETVLFPTLQPFVSNYINLTDDRKFGIFWILFGSTSKQTLVIVHCENTVSRKCEYGVLEITSDTKVSSHES